LPEPALLISGLRVSWPSPGGYLDAVRGVDLAVNPGETVALVGESGCGKTLTALSAISLIPKPGKVTGGKILLDGKDVRSLEGEELRKLRGRSAGMVFQEPMTSLNPVFTVGFQLAEAVNPEGGLTRSEVKNRSIELLREVGIPEPEKRLDSYPHELSGGLRQRVMIATAIAQNPRLLIADEPTTALDVTVEAQIMHLLERLKEERGIAVLLITHDLGIVRRHAERVYVMYAGYVVEEGGAESIFNCPSHPYTRGLIRSLPRRGEPLTPIPGNVPSLFGIPSGCPFRDRCILAISACSEGLPPLAAAPGKNLSRCLRSCEDV
jgi:oligopeptide/dipeptide ABC transporter ATP-binding protein